MLAIQNKKFEWKVATPVFSEKVEQLCSTCDVFRSRKLWWEHPNSFECHDCYTKRDWETEVSPVGLGETISLENYEHSRRALQESLSINFGGLLIYTMCVV